MTNRDPFTWSMLRAVLRDHPDAGLDDGWIVALYLHEVTA